MRRPTTLVLYWGGYPTTVTSKWQRFLSIVQRCQQQGWRSYLICVATPEDPALVEPFRMAGCEIIVQPRSRREIDVRSIWQKQRLLRRLKCDIFHCDNDHTSPLIAAMLAGVPVRIWSQLSMSPYYERGISPRGLHHLSLSTRLSYWCTSRVMAISNQVRQELVDSVGSDKKIDTVYVPVDHERFAGAARGEIRRELGLCPSDILITSVGHAIPVKGWDIAIQAFARVHRSHPCTHLVFVGGTTSPREAIFFQSLKTLIEESNTSGGIHFVGYRHDIPEILKASDIFVLPSRSEGCCCALIEAMASGLPCIATRVGGIPEVVNHGKNGLLFERENTEELARHLVSLAEDRGLRLRIASEAAQTSREFSMQAYVDKVCDCYATLLHTGSCRSI
jgi:glycosyltransferase involved in cell wall biosynthesis